MNGDGKADVVCISDDGGIRVYEAKDVDNFYEPGTVWNDEAFGFFTNNPKWVHEFLFFYLLKAHQLKQGTWIQEHFLMLSTCIDKDIIYLCKML